MGIPKLKRFMSNSSRWSTIKVTGKVVIDGTSLCYTLNSNHEWSYGGEYKEFYTTVTEYFRELQTLGIEPYVILDGVDPDNSKYYTYIKRNEERINHIASCQLQGTSPKNILRPLFTLPVFVDALKDMGIKFLVADGEADRDIASLANSLSSPVISNDSDFFIFNIDAGYIPLNSGSLTYFREPVQCFKYMEFDTKFGLSNDHRLYIPFIAGNDFHNAISLRQLRLRLHPQIQDIITRTKGAGLTCETDIELRPLGGEQAVRAMSKVRSHYRVKPRSYEDLASTRRVCELYPHAPEWIMREYKKGMFMAPIMSLVTSPVKRWRHTIVIEDFSQPSAWKITDIAKKFIAGAILGDQGDKMNVSKTVVSQSSVGLSLADEKIKLAHKHLNILPVPINDIPSLTVSNRREIMFRVLHYQHPVESVIIPENLLLAMIASRCWIKNMTHSKADKNQLVQSLICCILTCYGHLPSPAHFQSSSLEKENMLTFLHAYTQWQCMLHHVIAFNQVLGHPFPYTSPAKLFSSKVLLHFYQCEPEILQRVMDTLAIQMFSIITEGHDMSLDQCVTTKALQEDVMIAPSTKKRRFM